MNNDQPDSPQPAAPARPDNLPENHKVKRTGASDVLLALTAFFVTLLLIVIFILQNMDDVRISFLGFNGQIPLALAMLLSVITGALLMALAAGARVLQLRHTAARHRREETV